MTATAQQAADYLEQVYNTYPALTPPRALVTIAGRPYRIHPDPMTGNLISRIGWLHGTGRTLGVILRNHTTGLIYVTGMAGLDHVPHQTVHTALVAALGITPTPTEEP